MEASPAMQGRMSEEAHGVTLPTPHHKINYFLIFYTLVILTVVTVLVAFWRAPNELVNVCLALLIATIKATFVCRYFMHLKFEGKLIYLILFVPVFLAVVLIFALVPDITKGIHHLFNTPGAMEHDAAIGAP
jgi:cytochrome c oxidase subunit 4